MTYINVDDTSGHSLGNPNYYYKGYNKCNKDAFKTFQTSANKKECLQAISALGDIDPLWALSHYHYHKKGKQTYRKSILNVLKNSCLTDIKRFNTYPSDLHTDDYKLTYIILNSAYPSGICGPKTSCFKKIMHQLLSPVLTHRFIGKANFVNILNTIKNTTKKGQAKDFLNSLLVNNDLELRLTGNYYLKNNILIDNYSTRDNILKQYNDNINQKKADNRREFTDNITQQKKYLLVMNTFSTSVIQDPATYYLYPYYEFTNIVAKNLYGNTYENKYNTAEELITHVKKKGISVQAYTDKTSKTTDTNTEAPNNLTRFEYFANIFDPFNTHKQRDRTNNNTLTFYTLAEKSSAACSTRNSCTNIGNSQRKFSKKAIPLFMRSKAAIFLMREVYKNAPKQARK